MSGCEVFGKPDFDPFLTVQDMIDLLSEVPPWLRSTARVRASDRHDETGTMYLIRRPDVTPTFVDGVLYVDIDGDGWAETA